jgi:transposase
MYYCVLDLHAKSSVYAMVTRRGKRISEGKVPSTRRGFQTMLKHADGQKVRVVVEASTRSRWAAMTLEGLGAEVVVVDPRKVRVIAETKHKTDKTDARILADLLRTGALPKAVWQIPRDTHELREKMRMRWSLVRQRTALVLRARSMLASVGITLGKRALMSEATWDRLMRRKSLPSELKALLGILHRTIQDMTQAIAEVEALYASQLEDPVVKRLQQIPGVGPIVALTTVASLGTPTRFKDSRAAAAYTGLIPSERSSGERHRRGHITKQGPSELRRVWIQAANAALRMPAHPVGRWSNRLIHRRGRGVAIVALARRLFRWAFAVWRDNHEFNPQLVGLVR